METTIGTFFAQQGIYGIIILALGTVILWQQKRIDKKDDQYDALQDKRKADADSFTKTYVETTKEVVTSQTNNTNAVNLLQKSVETLVTGFQNFMNGRGKK